MRILQKFRGEMVDITDQIIPFPPTQYCQHDENSQCVLCNQQLFEVPFEIAGAYSSYVISEKLRKAKNAYYGKGNSKLSDADYDALEGSLRGIDPTAEILVKVGKEMDK